MSDFDSNAHDLRAHSEKKLRAILRYSFAGLALIVGAIVSCETMEPDVDVKALKDAAYNRGKISGMSQCVP